MRNTDEFYSYAEKKIINPNSHKVTFYSNRHNNSSFTALDLIKRIVLYGFIIFIISCLVFYPNNKEQTKNFIDDMSFIVSESNNIINTIVNEYNNDNFSLNYKNDLQNKLTNLKTKDLTKYKDSKYHTIIAIMNEIIEETEHSVNMIVESSTRDSYTASSLNSNLKSIRNNVGVFRESLFKFFDDNNILYKINDDGSYTYSL